MSRRLGNRTEMLTALVAALAILVGPAMAYGNCCCTPSASHETHPQSTEDGELGLVCTGTAQPPTVAATRPCCSPAIESTVCDAMLPGAESPVPAKGPCPCEDACCDTLVDESVAILAQPSVPRDLTANCISLPAVLDAAAWDLSPTLGDVHREPSFLSARAHCALLCRWLN